MGSIKDALLLDSADKTPEQVRARAALSERRWENVRWVTIIAFGVLIGLVAHSLIVYVVFHEWLERSI